MSFTPNTDLQAAPNFSTIGFHSETDHGVIHRIVRFSGTKGNPVYSVDFKNFDPAVKEDPAWFQSDDFLNEVVTIILIVEIYTERYPNRILRFCPASKMNAMAFNHIRGRFKNLLSGWCTFQGAKGHPERNCQETIHHSFTIRRKAITYFSVHTLENNWRATSHVFNIPFKIELERSLHIGLVLPEDLNN